MTQWQATAPAPVRRPRARRRKAVAAVVAAGAVLVAAGIISAIATRAAPRDYRDPIQLAAAVKAHEHAASASCARLHGLTYLCSAASTGLTMGTYQVTVAADGSSYSTATP